MLYLRIIESPTKAGMYLDKLMSVCGIADVNISTINHTARDAKRHVLKGDDDAVFETMKDCDATVLDTTEGSPTYGQTIPKLDITQKNEIKSIVKNIESVVGFASKSTIVGLVYHLIYSDATGLYKRCLLLDNTDNRLNILLLNTFYELTEEYQNLRFRSTLKQNLM